MCQAVGSILHIEPINPSNKGSGVSSLLQMRTLSFWEVKPLLKFLKLIRERCRVQVPGPLRPSLCSNLCVVNASHPPVSERRVDSQRLSHAKYKDA